MNVAAFEYPSADGLTSMTCTLEGVNSRFFCHRAESLDLGVASNHCSRLDCINHENINATGRWSFPAGTSIAGESRSSTLNIVGILHLKVRIDADGSS